MFHPDVSPSSSEPDQPIIGIIGIGSMGRMYAKHLSDAGWRRSVPWPPLQVPLLITSHRYRIHICDRPEKFEDVKRDFRGTRDRSTLVSFSYANPSLQMYRESLSSLMVMESPDPQTGSFTL